MGTTLRPASPVPFRGTRAAHLHVAGPIYLLGIGIAVLCFSNAVNLLVGQPY